MANKIETNSKDFKPRINLNHNIYYTKMNLGNVFCFQKQEKHFEIVLGKMLNYLHSVVWIILFSLYYRFSTGLWCTGNHNLHKKLLKNNYLNNNYY